MSNRFTPKTSNRPVKSPATCPALQEVEKLICIAPEGDEQKAYNNGVLDAFNAFKSAVKAVKKAK